MPFGSKMNFTKNAYIGKANIPSYSTSNFDAENNVIKSENNIDQQNQQQGNTQSYDAKNVTTGATNQGKLY